MPCCNDLSPITCNLLLRQQSVVDGHLSSADRQTELSFGIMSRAQHACLLNGDADMLQAMFTLVGNEQDPNQNVIYVVVSNWGKSLL